MYRGDNDLYVVRPMTVRISYRDDGSLHIRYTDGNGLPTAKSLVAGDEFILNIDAVVTKMTPAMTAAVEGALALEDRQMEGFNK